MSTFNYGGLASRIYTWGIKRTGQEGFYFDFFEHSDLDVKSGDRVLDAGCGDLFLTRGFLKEYFEERALETQVYAFDKSNHMLERAENVKKSLLPYITGCCPGVE
jgi:ubiquinone/menaquinone biosynthesis C-methylase UbiE